MTAENCAARFCDHPPTRGLLCTQHGQRLADHYGAREGTGPVGRVAHGLPWMYEHVALAYPALTGWSKPSVHGFGVDDPEAEKLSAVLALRTDIHDHLSETVADLARRIGRQGPRLATTQRIRVQRCAGWLLAHIESLQAAHGVPGGAGDEAIAAVLQEADDLASRAHALAPWRPAPTRLDGIPCRCGAVGTVHDHGDVRKCWRCGRVYSEDEWAVLCKVLAHRFSDHEGRTA